jgi:NhaP-type Na+/H+ or K+/H+ antiporter
MNSTDHESKHFRIIDTERFGDDTFSTILFVCLALFVVSTFRIALNNAPRLLNAIPESGCLMLFGVVAGFLSQVTLGREAFPFNENLFFVVLVPPIIFEAGYNLRIRFFAANFWVILSFAVIGTILNNAIVSLSLFGIGATNVFSSALSLIDWLVFGSLMAAVDPVAVLAIFQHMHINEEVNFFCVSLLFC